MCIRDRCRSGRSGVRVPLATFASWGCWSSSSFARSWRRWWAGCISRFYCVFDCPLFCYNKRWIIIKKIIIINTSTTCHKCDTHETRTQQVLWNQHLVAWYSEAVHLTSSTLASQSAKVVDSALFEETATSCGSHHSGIMCQRRNVCCAATAKDIGYGVRVIPFAVVWLYMYWLAVAFPAVQTYAGSVW